MNRPLWRVVGLQFSAHANMSGFVTYPLESTYFSNFGADVWNCSLPLAQILAMFTPSASKGPGGSQQVAAPWHPAKTFPSQRSGPSILLCGVPLPLPQICCCRHAGGLTWYIQAADGRVCITVCFTRCQVVDDAPLLQSCDHDGLPRKYSHRHFRSSDVNITPSRNIQQRLTLFLPTVSPLAIIGPHKQV